MNRDTVKSSFIEKQMARHILQASMKNTKHNLAPKTIAKRWSKAQKAKLITVKNKTSKIAQDNVPVIGVGILATTLYFCRKPIMKMISGRYKK